MLNNLLWRGINNIVLLEDMFMDNDANRGTSYLPFIGFMVFLIGMVVVIVGAAKYFTAKRQFNLFYDQRDSVEVSKEKSEKELKTGKILMIVGGVLMLVSFFIY